MAFLIRKKLDGTVAEHWELGKSRLIVGRGDTAQARIADREMSREHFDIIARSGGYLIRDLQSKNGTLVNGQPITEVVLKFNDAIHAGESCFVFTETATLVEHLSPELGPQQPGQQPDPARPLYHRYLATVVGQHQPKQLRRD